MSTSFLRVAAGSLSAIGSFRRRIARRHGVALLLACSLAGCTIAVLSHTRWVTAPRLENLEVQRRSLTAQLGLLEQQPRSPRQPLDQRRTVGAEARLAHLPSQFQRVADAEGLAWMEATYGAKKIASRSLGERELRIRLRGTYAALIGFISRFLATQPSIALNAVIIDRGPESEGLVESELQLTAYFVPT